jgi:inner membrane protein
MDNITHTLIGASFARALPKRFQKPSIYWAAVIGNNLPDSDFIYSLLPGNKSIDYLIHHRGYTHTFLAAIPLGLLTAWIARRIGKEKGWDPRLIGIAILSAFMHIGADFMNNYGVHPFTPFWNQWIYGDAFFIVEPLLWFSLIPFVAQCATRVWARRVWWSLFIFMLGLIWLSPQALKVTAVFGSLYGLLIYGLQHWTQSRWVALGSFTSLIALFFGLSHWVKSEIKRDWITSVQGREQMTDIDAVPSPANPICWRSWVNSQDQKHYISRAAVVSLLPGFLPPEKCPMAQDFAQTATVTLPLLPSKPHLLWWKQYDIPIEQFEMIRKESCTFRRLLTFTRYPYLKIKSANEWIAGDLRFDREEGLGFSELMIQVPDQCTRGEPWMPPFYRN